MASLQQGLLQQCPLVLCGRSLEVAALYYTGVSSLGYCTRLITGLPTTISLLSLILNTTARVTLLQNPSGVPGPRSSDPSQDISSQPGASVPCDPAPSEPLARRGPAARPLAF